MRTLRRRHDSRCARWSEFLELAAATHAYCMQFCSFQLLRILAFSLRQGMTKARVGPMTAMQAERNHFESVRRGAVFGLRSARKEGMNSNWRG